MKKRKWIWFLLGMIVLAICGIGIVFHLRPDWKFRVADVMGSWFRSVSIEQVEYQEEELKKVPVSEMERNDTLLLINEEHPMPENYEPDLVFYKDTDVKMAEAATEAFHSLAEYIKNKTGEKLYIRDSYRSTEEQEVVYQEQPEVAAIPGSSEHATGLALDVYVAQFAGYGFLKSESGQLVNRDCWNYGFIIRYPQFREEDTKIPYEPWHIRYVGVPHAEIMMKNNMILEEYIESLEIGKFYSSCGYIITRQTGDTVSVPNDLQNVTVSSDNMGNWIVTGKWKEK